MITNDIFINDIIDFVEWAKPFWYNKMDNFKKAYDSDLYNKIKNNILEDITPDILIDFIKNNIGCGIYSLLSNKNAIVYFLEINKNDFINDTGFKELYENKIYKKIISNEKVSDNDIDILYNKISKYCFSKDYELKDPIISIIAD